MDASRGRVVCGRAALALALFAAPLARAEDTFDAPPRVVAVGDVHGDYDQLVRVLKGAALLDERLGWAGGRTHLVQTGDRVDRGPDSRKVMDLFMRLEKEAKKAGGMVHPLTGNHEAMNMLGDLRYVSPKEFAAFETPDSMLRREELWKRWRREKARKGGAAADEDRAAFDKEHPLGFVEHAQAFSSSGQYGSWIVQQNAVVRIGDTLFLHGGISPKYADFSLRDLNERVRQELREADPDTALLVRDPEGPLWFRGLAQGDPAPLSAHLDAVLKKYGCKRMVVGHTPTEGLLVMPRYGGRLVMIDVGLSAVYGGPPAALLLEEGRAFALHRGRRLPLPEDEGEALVTYVRAAAALEPDPSRLQGLLGRLEEAVKAGMPQPR
jgi:Calcineurin-like phosphoesterase